MATSIIHATSRRASEYDLHFHKETLGLDASGLWYIAARPAGVSAGAKGSMKKFKSGKRSGFSLMELLAVVTILGIIAAIIVPRVTVSSDTAKQKVNAHNKATINAAVERFYIETGTWPANDLSDIGADTDYFPDGIPTNPIDGSAYALDATSHRVL
jgi:general secretion pathway protein G